MYRPYILQETMPSIQVNVEVEVKKKKKIKHSIKLMKINSHLPDSA